jgi:hypothetical protein
MFLGLPDPDPLVRGVDPYPDLDPYIILISSIVKKTCFLLFCDFFWTVYLFVGVLKVLDENSRIRIRIGIH